MAPTGEIDGVAKIAFSLLHAAGEQLGLAQHRRGEGRATHRTRAIGRCAELAREADDLVVRLTPV